MIEYTDILSVVLLQPRWGRPLKPLRMKRVSPLLLMYCWVSSWLVSQIFPKLLLSFKPSGSSVRRSWKCHILVQCLKGIKENRMLYHLMTTPWLTATINLLDSSDLLKNIMAPSWSHSSWLRHEVSCMKKKETKLFNKLLLLFVALRVWRLLNGYNVKTEFDLMLLKSFHDERMIN